MSDIHTFLGIFMQATVLYEQHEVQMRCTKKSFFTFPFVFTANGVPFQSYYFKTLLLENDDLIFIKVDQWSFLFVVQRYDFSEI